MRQGEQVEREKAILSTLLAVEAVPEANREAAWNFGRDTLGQRGYISPEDAQQPYDPTKFQVMVDSLRGPKAAAKTREIKVRNEDGSESIQIVEDTPGQTFTSAKAAPTQPPNLDALLAQAIQEGNESKINHVLGLMKRKADATRAPASAGGQGGMAGMYAATDPAAIAQGIISGDLPPVISDYGRVVQGAVATALQRKGFNLSDARIDWEATKKHIQTMNGAQQLRLNQAINSLPDMLDNVDALSKQWKGGNFAILNRANVALAKGGAYGPDAASIANQLDAQIADVVADLGNVYMGGNSPTERALELAGKSLKAEWSEKVLVDMVALAKKNVTIRRNSINATGVQGASENNAYGFQAPGGAAPAGAPTGETPYARYLRLQAASKK